MTLGSRHHDKMKFKYHTEWFEDENKKQIPIKRPKIEIVFRKNAETKNIDTNPEFRTHGLVDSGADVCFIPRKIADILQIDLTGAKKEASTGVGGKINTYKTKIYLEVIYRNMPVGIDMVDVTIPEKDPDDIDFKQNILLGRSQLFKKYEITFNESKKTIEFKRIK